VEGLGLTVVGLCEDPREALRILAARDCEILVTGAGGDQLVRAALAMRPRLKILVITSLDQDEIAATLEAGAAACITEAAPREDLAAALLHACSSSIYLPEHCRRPSHPEPAAVAEALEAGLTRRELEVIRLVAEGRTNAELARHLQVALQTVKFHLSNIYRKLEVTNRTEASRWAASRGLLSDGTDASSAA
jgi:DNA-binding NarL/FixJ family response regulator